MTKEKLCACGCGNFIYFTNRTSKNIKFIHGHNKPWLGKKRTFSSEHRLKLSKAGIGRKRLKVLKGEANPSWKGDDASYYAIHIYLKSTFGKADTCENRDNQFLSFKCSEKSDNFQWAKKTLSSYSRFKEDYYKLCVSCHRKYDYLKE